MTNKNMYGLSISGGGTKGAGVVGILEEVMQKYTPDIISGTSVGAMIAPLVNIVDWKSDYENDPTFVMMKYLMLNATSRDIWSVKPVTDSGKFTPTAVLRAAFGMGSLGEMGSIEKRYRQILTRELFYEKVHKKSPVWVTSVNFNSGARDRTNISTVHYDSAISIIMASSSLPVFAEGVEDDMDEYFYDGGVREHNSGAWLLRTYPDITHHVSIYTRPQDYNIVIDDWKPKNILKVLERTIEIQGIEISKKDEFEEKVVANENNVELYQLFLPRIMQGVYDVNHDRLLELYKAGLNEGSKFEI